MTAKQKKLFLLTSMMSVFVMAVTVLFTGGKLKFSPLNVRGTGSAVEGSITWNYTDTEKTAHDTNEYSFLKQTSRGTGIYLYSKGSRAVNSNRIFSSKKDTNHTDYGVYITSSAGTSSSLFEFQSITSISIKTSSLGGDTGTIAIYGGDMSTTPLITKTVLYAGQTLSYTPSSTMRYLVIAPTNNYEVDIESITLNYSCTPGGMPEVKTLSSISVSGETTSFTVGDQFSFGGTVTAHYSDSSTSDVTTLSTFSGYNMSQIGEQTITVSYSEDAVARMTTYTITVSDVPEGLIIVGTYNYVSRSKYSTPDWSLHNMTITFNSDGTAMWRNQRTGNLGNKFDCKVYFIYEATENASNITIEMLHTSYDFTKDGAYDNQASSFSGGGYDRPIDAGFGGSNVHNNSGVLSLDRSTLTICTYDKDHSYEVYDTFTFTLAS